MTPADCLQNIRDHTARHPELQRAHHFLFDLRAGIVTKPADVMVMGLNPGEDPTDWIRHPITPAMQAASQIHEESSEIDFMHPRIRQWTKDIHDICGTENATQSEGFFWSSRRGGGNFKERFGYFPRKSPHLSFCADMNAALIDHFDPLVMVIVGQEFLPLAKKLYNLQLLDHKPRLIERGNLIEYYKGAGRHWVRTVHWRAHGFSEDERVVLRQYIQRIMAVARQQRP